MLDARAVEALGDVLEMVNLRRSAITSITPKATDTFR